MPWNSTTKMMTAPISIGDISQAVGLSSSDLGTLVKDGSINAMAKYKPVRSSSPGTPDREYARYGLSEPAAFTPNTTPTRTLPPAWEYLRPRGAEYNEWYRALDFDGYDRNATSPIHLEMNKLYLRDLNGCYIWKDAGVNNDPYHTGEWVADRSLSVSELLVSRLTTYEDMYITLVFYVYDASGQNIVDAQIVATNKKFRQLSSTEPIVIRFAGDDITAEDNITYPKIPILYDMAYDGRKFDVAVCLCNTGPSGTAPYTVITTTQTCYSLAFDRRNLTDRVSVYAESSGSLQKVIGTILADNLVLVKTGTSGSYNIYELQNRPIRGRFNIETGYSAVNFDVITTISNVGGTIGLPPTDPSATGVVSYTALSISPTTDGQIETIYPTTATVGDIYIHSQAPQEINVRAVMQYSNGSYGTESRDFSNILTITT